MSANNQVLIIRGKRKGTYEVHLWFCVDNPFEKSKETLLRTFKDLEKAIKFGNNYAKDEMIEYGCSVMFY